MKAITNYFGNSPEKRSICCCVQICPDIVLLVCLSQVLKQPQKLINFKDGIPKTFDFFLRLKKNAKLKE